MITGNFQMLLMESISPSKRLLVAVCFHYNYKHTHSPVLLAVADPKYNCLYADVGANGSCDDRGIWRNSSIAKLLSDDKLGVPKPQKIPNSE